MNSKGWALVGMIPIGLALVIIGVTKCAIPVIAWTWWDVCISAGILMVTIPLALFWMAYELSWLYVPTSKDLEEFERRQKEEP